MQNYFKIRPHQQGTINKQTNKQEEVLQVYIVLCILLFELAVFPPNHFCFWLFYLHKVSVNKETKNNGKFLYSGVGCFEYFWSDAWIFPQKNKYEVSNSYMDHMRLHDVGPLCFPANRGSYTSSAGLLLHSKL